MSGHTNGPWRIGSVVSAHVIKGTGKCCFCSKGWDLLAVVEDDELDSERFTREVHKHLWLDFDGEAWRVIIGPSGESIVGMYDYEDGGVCSSEADARLIAAAPELLDALRELADSVDAWNKDVEAVIGRPPHTGMATQKARAAIQKATGEQP